MRQYLYQFHLYLAGLPATGRLFYVLLFFLLDLLIVLGIVAALDAGPKWLEVGTLCVIIAYALAMKKLWKFIKQ